MTADQLAQLLDELGKRLGPAGEHVYQLTVRQVVIESLLWGCLGLFLVALSVPALIAMRRSDRKAIAEGRPESDLFGWWGTTWLTGMSLVPGLAILVFVSTQLLNPEFHAIMRLIGAVSR